MNYTDDEVMWFSEMETHGINVAASVARDLALMLLEASKEIDAAHEALEGHVDCQSQWHALNAKCVKLEVECDKRARHLQAEREAREEAERVTGHALGLLHEKCNQHLSACAKATALRDECDTLKRVYDAAQVMDTYEDFSEPIESGGCGCAPVDPGPSNAARLALWEALKDYEEGEDEHHCGGCGARVCDGCEHQGERDNG